MILTTASHFLRRGNVAAAASAVGASSSVSQSSSFVAAAAAGVCRTLMATAAPAAAADTASPPLSLRKTSLHAWHQERGGEMVPFAGYELPVLYKGDKATEHSGVLQEHLWCRTEGQAALFDVSHMGQIRWYGKDRARFVEQVVVSDIQGLATNTGCLSLITNAQGGILDDTVITACDDHVYMVVNGATKFTDMDHFQQQLEDFDGDVTMEYLDETMQLLALQGPGAATVLAKLLPPAIDLTKVPFMASLNNVTLLGSIEGCRITRCGYTGEDGFELSIPSGSETIAVASALCDTYPDMVQPTGLGARDSLRLEAGLCLYGNDLNDTIDPVMGGLAWTLGKPKSRRRLEQGYVGSHTFVTPDGKLRKPSQKRVGIIGMKAPARQNTIIYAPDDATKIIGAITSGTYSPTLKVPIAMGYVDTEYAKPQTDVQLKIRKKFVPAHVTTMPFVEARYYRVPA